MDLDQLESPEEAMTEKVIVRAMREGDLDAIVRIDAASRGRRRPKYFETMIERNVKQAGLQISMVAEIDGRIVGFGLGTLYYGAFGITEPSASIEAIGVDPGARRQGVAQALMRQLRMQLHALGVTTMRTEVAWGDFDLLAFFKKEGFSPAARLCLECKLED
ncbi:MAG: GNAT family N-acetyltransferase [Acidobacteria bacterium]|nr:GNAT family N-acetyltransferase [Acidobacteriota bacterium]